jgi:hypothetical protein
LNVPSALFGKISAKLPGGGAQPGLIRRGPSRIGEFGREKWGDCSAGIREKFLHPGNLDRVDSATSGGLRFGMHLAKSA